MRILRAIVASSLLLQASTASAVLVTMEPDDFAVGTDVSHAWAANGITFQRVRALNGGLFEYSPVLVQTETAFFPAVTGFRVFGSSGPINDFPSCYFAGTPNCHANANDSLTAMRIDFARPIDSIELVGAYSNDELGIFLLGADGQRLQRAGNVIQTTSEGLQYLSVHAERPSRDVYSVLIGGVIGASSVDWIRLNVPEPGTLALLGLGLFGVGLAPRRRPL